MRLAVYGASGYQAKLVLAELSHRSLDVVLVGRDAERLRQAATTVGLADHERRTAGIDDHGALVAAFSGCDAVVNCAGPFVDTGGAVVRAAIDAGCHYVDTAGGQRHLKTVFDTFAGEAERAGVTVVPATNDGCLPVDLIAHVIADRVLSIAGITTSHVIVGGGGPSRGSLRSALRTADALTTGGLTYDHGEWHTGLAARHTSVILPGTSEPTAMARFPLAEVVTIPRHVPVDHVESLVEATLSARLGTPLSAELIDTLPEGPTEQARLGQRFTCVVDATSADGRTTRGLVQGTDTYGTTAVIAVEAARRLAANGAKPGVLAPAQAFDPADFLDFLTAYGVRWSIDADHQP
ncbi:saccharopine dehydrogenase NADP-binding domain-containing protein [Umezawaea sp. Da 62-37]|uniref:saccharopine dehydrogenase family protein n=1 Tax=Umezawaea sp. Da 62-37 TaxID=3075927 RepID=UPI0028F6EB4E|nr:saccharopine dehydrogenase NADP-binding domain-containing protein [Umezawaea sp. Da 62-37]WNV85464.1 saccharopine dehydrogenase NADP-binding domain-containing protein [Umezawaea sp. Da 62-37]